jgi:uncharacterized protein YrrD
METLYKDNFTGKHEGETSGNNPFRLLTANTLLGNKVLNDEDEYMGKIHDIMLDVKQGKIEYFSSSF